MKPTAPVVNLNRFSILSVCVLTAAILTACHPASDTSQPSSVEQPAIETPVVDEPDIVEQTEPTSSDIEQMHKNYQRAISQMYEEMQLVESINNIDVAFARGMLGHHRGAIDLTKFGQRYVVDEELRNLASTIKTTEQTEIDALRKWLASHPDTHEAEPVMEEARQAYGYAMTAMRNKMEQGISSDNPDIVFAQSMLAHHHGAEAMAKIQLKYGQNEEMRTLATQIIQEQLSEIAALEAWLQTQGVEVTPKLVVPTVAEEATTDDLELVDATADADAKSEPKSLEAQIVEVTTSETEQPE